MEDLKPWEKAAKAMESEETKPWEKAALKKKESTTDSGKAGLTSFAGSDPFKTPAAPEIPTVLVGEQKAKHSRTCRA